MAASWTDTEPGFFAMRHELRRLVERARRRRRWVLLGTLGAAVMGAMMALNAPHRYHAQVTVRVTEVVDFHMPRSAWTDRELRSFVTSVAFTNEVLGKVYQTHLADFAPAPTMARAVERLREDVEVYTARNRIMIESEATTGPRSAHVILRYSSPREDRAIAVLKALAQPIMESSTKRRRLEAQQELERVALQLEGAKNMVNVARAQALTRAGLPMAGAGSISPVRMVELDSALKEAHLRVARFQQEMDDAALRAKNEARKSGIDFEIVEESVERPLPRLPVVLAAAVLTFLLAWPLVTIVVGAFAGTVDTLEDIRRLGVPVLGHLPALAVSIPQTTDEMTVHGQGTLDQPSQPPGPGQATPAN
jgi:hypothetical protein